MASTFPTILSSRPSLPQQYYCCFQQPLQQHFLSHHRSLQRNFVFIRSKQIANYKPRTLDRVVDKKSLKKIKTATNNQQAGSGQFPLAHYHDSKQNISNRHIKPQVLIFQGDATADRWQRNKHKQQKDTTGINIRNLGRINRKRSPDHRRKFAFPPPIHHEPLPISPFKNLGAIRNTNHLQTTAHISSTDQYDQMLELSEAMYKQSLHAKEMSYKQKPWGQLKQSILLEDYRCSFAKGEDKSCQDLPEELPQASILANFPHQFVQSAPNKQILQATAKTNTFDSLIFSKNLSTHEQLSSLHNLPNQKFESCKRRLNYKISIKQVNTARKMASNRRIQTDRNSMETYGAFGGEQGVCPKQRMYLMGEYKQ